MTAQAIAAIIQSIIAPVVMISACSIFVNGLLTRYGAVNDRMRLMAQERLSLCHLPDGSRASMFTDLGSERIALIDHQLQLLLGRHAQLRDSIFLLYLSVLFFVTDMFIIAAAGASSLDWLFTAALIVFLTGTLSFFVGVLVAVLEIRTSHSMISYEVGHVGIVGVG